MSSGVSNPAASLGACWFWGRFSFACASLDPNQVQQDLLILSCGAGAPKP